MQLDIVIVVVHVNNIPVQFLFHYLKAQKHAFFTILQLGLRSGPPLYSL